ncbi:MAG: hypothetical protein KDD61_04965 [Bdellovibrionales bacterium]|nr:hypothetical protein [Bdellovibrionales bacterium]
MGTCPSCQANVTDEFGLVVCDSCGTTLFVDMDGIPTMSEPNSSDESDPINYANAGVVEVPDYTEESHPQVNFPSGDNLERESDYFTSEADETFEEVAEGNHVPWNSSESEFEVSATVPEELDGIAEEEDVKMGENFVEGDSLPPHQEIGEAASSGEDWLESVSDEGQDQNVFSESIESVPPAYAPEDMSEIADYGNSEISQGREGNLLFTVKIEGIDSKDIREELMAAMEDSRFLWDEKAILETAKNGCIKIEGVSAVKASVLIQRLRGMPLKISWEQNAIFVS